jgi:hypothetical protein
MKNSKTNNMNKSDRLSFVCANIKKLGFNWEWSKQANIFFALQKHNCIIINYEAISSTPKISFGFASILNLNS